MIEHVPEPLEILRSVRVALASSPKARGFKARVFFETPCIEWILRHRAIWDFFHEHCSLFNAGSLGLAFRRAEFVMERVSTSLVSRISGWKPAQQILKKSCQQPERLCG
ncbi:hypothetical protein [Laribacter hongkongensis]|uniref:hypothetical protein n=1 Tax=Laribacter hongkongensis TaxID=168471 RepID=UPI003570E4B7